LLSVCVCVCVCVYFIHITGDITFNLFFSTFAMNKLKISFLLVNNHIPGIVNYRKRNKLRSIAITIVK